jgi:hypothetical protein
MRKALLLATTSVAALTFAAVALGANTASVAISYSGTSTTLHVSIPQSTDPIARIAIYAPAGYTANLSAPAGTAIGDVTASGFARDLGLTVPLSGSVVPDNAIQHVSDACAPGPHAAVWILNLSVAGNSIQLPVYVDPTSSAETALGSYKLVTCFGPPDVPPGTPGRSPNGVQLLDAKFTVNKVFTTPSSAGVERWETLFTPYNPGQGTVNAAGTFEARSLVGVPDSVAVKAVSVKHKTYQVSGVATEGGVPAAGVSVQLYRGVSAGTLVRVTSAKTDAKGAFSFAGAFGKAKLLVFQAKASAGERATACTSPLPVAPAGCAGATLSPWAGNSTAVTVRR